MLHKLDAGSIACASLMAAMASLDTFRTAKAQRAASEFWLMSASYALKVGVQSSWSVAR